MFSGNMDFCFLKGFIVVLLIQHCKAQDQSTSSLPSTAVAPQDDGALPQETELPPWEVVPAVAPPSLKEVEEAVQEASEQAEGPGAEEVLKELLERVVEAALGEAGGRGEEKVEEAGEQEVAEGQGVGEELGVAEAEVEAEAETGVTEEAVEEEVVVVEDVGATGDVRGGEQQEVVAAGVEEEVEEVKGEVEAIEADLAEAASKEAGVVEAVAEPVEETTTVTEEVGGATEEQETIDKSPVAPEVTQEAVEEPVAAVEQEEGGEIAVETGGAEEVVMMAGEELEAETEAQETEEALEEVGVVVVEVQSPEQETVFDSDPGLGVAEVEQVGDVVGEGEVEVEEAQIGEGEGGEQAVELAPDDYEEMETTQSVVGEPVEKEEEIAEGEVEGGEGTEVTEGVEVVEEGGIGIAGGEVWEMGEAAGGDGESMIEGEGEVVVVVDEEEVVLVEGVDPQRPAGEEEQITLETSDPSQAEDQEVLVIPVPEPGDGGDDDTSIEQGFDDQAIPPGPSLGGGETESNVMGGEELLEEESNHANEIITATDDLLSHDPAVNEPTLGNFVEEILATPPQSEGVEPGETNELVEETANNSEVGELGLEVWKIGAIFAAVFLVLETIFIIVYILKCRNKSSSALAPERACEEGCVEAEAATGADCNDDTLPASNGDTQQIAALDPSDLALSLTQQPQEQQQQEEQGIAMSALQPNCLESANPVPGPDPSQDLRTSIL